MTNEQHRRTGPDDSGARDERGAEGRTSASEWLVAVVAATMVLGAVGHIAYHGFTQSSGPPILTVRTDSIASSGAAHVVLFTVGNEGGEAAASVTIEGTLKQDTTVIQESAASVDYVPVQAERSGGLLFTHDPRRYRLEVRATGYDLP